MLFESRVRVILLVDFVNQFLRQDKEFMHPYNDYTSFPPIAVSIRTSERKKTIAGVLYSITEGLFPITVRRTVAEL